MKISIKFLSLLLVALFANVSFGANANYTFTSTGWFNGATAISTPSLVNTDSVTVTSGTWTLTGTTNVKGVSLQGGTLGINSRTLNGRVAVAGTTTITATSGSINGTLAVASGTLTLGTNLSPSRTNLKGGTLALATFDLSNSVNVLASSSISATSNAASIAALTVRAGTLTIASSNIQMSSLTMTGGTLNLASFLVSNSGNISITGNSTISGSGAGILDASNNTLTLNNGDLTIDNAEVIIDDLTFSSANDVNTLNAGRLAFDNSGNHNVNNASASRHVNGTIRVYVDNSSTNLNTYPLGNGTVYAPVRLQPNGNDSSGTTLSTVPGNGNFGVHYFDLTYFDEKHPVVNFDNTIVGASGSEYWVITRSVTKPAASFGFFLNTTGTTYGLSAVVNTSFLSIAL